jgi:dipeptidyl aminopeptidase/acylaminoacyl peptidase
MNGLRVCVLTASIGLGLPAPAAPPPLSAFSRHADTETVKISPDGKHLAVTSRSGQTETLTVLNFPEGTVAGRTDLTPQIDINRFTWVSDTHLLINPALRFLGDMPVTMPSEELLDFEVGSNDRRLVYGYWVGLADSSPVSLEFTYRTGRPLTDATYPIAEVMGTIPEGSESVLIQTRSRDAKTNSTSLQRVNIRNAKLSRITGSPVWNAQYVLDAQEQPLLVSGEDDDGNLETWIYEGKDKPWRRIAATSARDGHITPIAVTSKPGEYLALDSMAAPTNAVVVWKPDGGVIRRLFHRPDADLRVEGIDPNRQAWLFAYDEHYPQYWYPDPEHPLARAHRMLREKFKDANVRFTSTSRDMSIAVARVSAPALAPLFCVVDVKELEITQRIRSRRDLTPDDLSPTDPIELTVRDGMKLRGYLTTPKGSNGKNLSMVVKVHDGPYDGYDAYDFDPDVQLLASRGFAVLQVNYRGSAGRGRDFRYAGYGQWGRAMQDDLTDAVKWTVSAGIAHKDRICIYGEGYGAYAALTATFRERDLFRCAAGLSGIYDLWALHGQADLRGRAGSRRYLDEAIGSDKKALRELSPTHNTDKMRAAVLLIDGIDDGRVPEAHTRRLQAALVKSNNTPVWISGDSARAQVTGLKDPFATQQQMLTFFEKYAGRTAGVAGR